ncbi:MAG: carboxylesterase family protein, partial [Acidobacteriaceae bacterium]
MAQISRRDALKTMVLTAGAGALATVPAHGQAGSAGYPAIAPAAGDTIVVSDSAPVVDTAAGKVRGYVRKDIYTFKGIPYADTTAGANRFMPPQKAKPWTGVRSSMQFGDVCPQPARFGWHDDEEAWMFSWNDGIPG